MAMACFRSVTVGPFLELECNVPALNLRNSPATRLCCAFVGALDFNLGITPSQGRLVQPHLQRAIELVGLLEGDEMTGVSDHD